MIFSEEMVSHLTPLVTEILHTPPLKMAILQRLVADPEKESEKIEEIARSTEDDRLAVQSIISHLLFCEKKKPQPVTLLHECPNCHFFNQIDLTDVNKE